MLEICQSFFSRLNETDIRYCHWKSNSHLDAAVSGKTDLDVLVHPDDRSAFEQELASADFKRILSPLAKRFPGFEDYLGFDQTTAELVHLHVHYGLILGRKYIKNHWYPIEQLYFDNLTSRLDVKIPCPELELITLCLRAHLKLDYLALLKHAIRDLLPGRYTALPADIENEIRELSRERDHEVFASLLQQSGLPIELSWFEKFLKRFSDGKLRAFQLWAGHYQVRRYLRKYRRDRGISVQVSYFRHFLANTRIGSRFLSPQKKTLPQGGRVISIVGADGSGKSTLIVDIEKWLSWKLITRRHYYGIPKDFVREICGLIWTVTDTFKLKRLEELVSNLFWLHVARARRKVSDRTKHDIAKGYVAITDRFPLSDFRSMSTPMDNPRIDPAARIAGSNLRELEEECYKELHNPDLIIVLQVEIEELRHRKSDLPRKTHESKADAVNSIKARDCLITVNANRPYEEVSRDVKRAVWAVL